MHRTTVETALVVLLAVCGGSPYTVAPMTASIQRREAAGGRERIRVVLQFLRIIGSREAQSQFGKLYFPILGRFLLGSFAATYAARGASEKPKAQVAALTGIAAVF